MHKLVSSHSQAGYVPTLMVAGRLIRSRIVTGEPGAKCPRSCMDNQGGG